MERRTVDLDAFVAEHGGEWRRLRMLVARPSLDADEADELVMLYQRTTTHLSIVRSRIPDSTILIELSNLVIATRAKLVRGPRFGWRPLARYFTHTLPAELYRARRWWVITALASVAITVAMAWYLTAHPLAVLDSVEAQSVADHEFVDYYSQYHASHFGLQVWTNNAVVTAKCLAAGVLILPVFYILFQNMFNLALVGAVMAGEGRTGTLLTYLTPHGLLELTCVFIGAGVGLRIGWAWIAPGLSRTRVQAMVDEGRAGVRIAVGLACTLAVAGILESYVTPSSLPPLLRVGIGALVWLLFLAYAVGRGRVVSAVRQPEDAEPAAYLVPTA
ncbi:stage II sporulation protein M [Actinoplanes sp. TBRC 11911]|uniref:stage II sporulation protein M n=1 Tax=Actinoplanes sp. TBRC 11911 TaxID=2729386 RepID=UPI00145FA631|nr:stage II sporulation protein M [Actinoplanes sp. TBRC 11911]NMO54861.1 stage II sporulation protein M [Actinoplanes sp. TBRC 11911]